MNDIFYLCPEKIGLEDIKDAFQKVEEIHIDVFSSSDTMQIKYKDKKIDFVIMDLGEFEDESDCKILSGENICSIVCISHHKIYYKEVLELAKILLIRWSGWLGNDSDGFLPMFNLVNINSFTYE